MFDDEASPLKLENLFSENEEEEGEAKLDYYGESFELEEIKGKKEFFGESEEKEWIDSEEYGENEQYFLYRRSGEDEYASLWEEREGSVEAFGEFEETEEEKERRREREELIELIKQKMFDRLLIKRKNAFLQKKLTEHFKKRKMESAFKVDAKTSDFEKKYLSRLYAFQEFKKSQENEMEELTLSMERYESNINLLEKDLDKKLKHFITRAKEVSLNLILARTGKKLSEKVVDALLKRQKKANEEKGREKLQYIQIKNLIEEKEGQIKALKHLGNELHLAEYEQLKIDNQNFAHKIEEKEDELVKLRLNTEDIMQSLAHIREKSHALGGDIELMEEKVYEVEHTFSQAKERLTKKRVQRNLIREQCTRLKTASGLLTKNDLLLDYEKTILEKKLLLKEQEKMKKLIHEKETKSTRSGNIYSHEPNKHRNYGRDSFYDNSALL